MSHFLAFTTNYVQFLIFLHLQQTCLNGLDNCKFTFQFTRLHHITPYCVTQRHIMSYFITIHHIASLKVTLCHNSSLYVTLCYIASLNITLCHISSLSVTSNISLSEFILYNNSLNFINLIFFLIDTQEE